MRHIMAKLTFYINYVISFYMMMLMIQTKCQDHPLKNHAPPLFIFGDSIFDAGNNNFINTSARANFWPYGQTFFKFPTGRFSDGRLVPDFIAKYAKLPVILIPPYLQPDNKEYRYGSNFASAGAGALVETHKGLVIDLQTQLGYFKHVSRVLKSKLGDAEAKVLLSRAVYLFSTVGVNDYVFLFQTNSSVLQSNSCQEEFVDMVMGNITTVIKEIYKMGGKKFGILNMPPISCVPFARAYANGACFEPMTPFVQLHNKQLPKFLHNLQNQLKGFKYSLADSHSFFEERMNHPSKYGFEEGKAACCGSAPYTGTSRCGGMRGVKFHLCPNASEYLFFDSGHPTDRANQQFANQFWSGNPSFTKPYNLKHLFEYE